MDGMFLGMKVKPPKRNPETGCLEWQGYIDPTTGYGNCYDPFTKKKGNAHRVAWKKEVGPIPPGRELHHLCKTRHCVDVEHLTLMTPREHGRLGTRAKLTIEQVREIRRRRAEGEVGTELAQEFGVTRMTIGTICAGRTWPDDTTCPSCGHRFDPYPPSPQ